MGNIDIKHNYNTVQLSATLEACGEHYESHEGKVKVNFQKEDVCILVTV